MRREKFLLIGLLLFLTIAPFIVPVGRTDVQIRVPEYDSNPFMPAVLGTENYIDSVYSSVIGTHDVFTDLQAGPDSTFDLMTEGTSGTIGWNEDFVDALSDLHTADTDVGTHSAFSEMQDFDLTYNTLTEGNTGGAGGSFDIDYIESLAESTYSTDTTWQTKCTITINPPSARDYLIIAAAGIQIQSTSYNVRAQLTVAGTAVNSITMRPKDSTDYYPFCVNYVAAGISAATTVNLQYATGTAGQVARIRDAYILAIDVGYYTAGDLYDSDLARTTTTSASWQTRSSVTLAADTYLVFASAVLDGSLATESTKARLYLGTAATTYSEFWQEPHVAGSTYLHPFGVSCRVISAGAYTLSLDYCSETSMTTGITYSNLVAIPESVFDNVYYTASTGTVSPAIASTWYDKVSNVYTAEAADHLILGSIQHRSNDITYSSSFRMNFDGSTDSDKIREDKDSTDYYSAFTFERNTLTAASHTDKIQYWGESTASDFKNAYLYSIELETVSPNYDLDLEIGWTSADNDDVYEYLCIYGGTQGVEALRVDIWNSVGSAWVNLEDDLVAGWNNLTIISYLNDATAEIRFTDTSDDSSTQETWQVDAVLLRTYSLNYALDLQIYWTTADNDEVNEEVCIYAGTQDAEALMVQVWDDVALAWDSLIADLTASTWNNYSVIEWNDDAELLIRFLGGSESSDTTQSSWNVDCVLLHTWTLTHTPVNDVLPSCSNIEDIDNLYPRKTLYQFPCSVTDAAGYADIDYLELSLSTYWTVRFDQDTHVFSEQSGTTFTELDTGGSTYSESGVNLDVTFKLYIEWEHTDILNQDLTQYIIDASAQTDTDTNTANDYDVLTALELNIFITNGVHDHYGTDDRGGLSEDIDADVDVSFASESYYPSASTIDIWVVQADVATSPWQLTYVAGSGADGTVQSDDAVGLDTYTIKAVKEGAGAGATALESTTSDYIADQVHVTSYTSTDSRININTASACTVTITYDYDESTVSTGTWTVEGVTMTVDILGHWDFTENKASTQGITYDTVADSGTQKDDTHGISDVDQNGQSQLQVWDRAIILVNFVTSDGRIDVSANCLIYVNFELEYDGHDFGSGDTITLTTYGAMTWDAGDLRFEYQRSEASVVAISFDITSLSEATYGITAFADPSNVQVIWDQVQVQSYTVTDDRVDIGTNVNIDFSILYDYDNSPVTDGTVTLEGYACSFISGSTWRCTHSEATVQGITFNTVVVSGNSYGITVVDENGQSKLVVWDQVIVVSYTVVTPAGDSRVDIGTTVYIDVELHFSYDSSDVGTGTITVNGISASYQSAGKWRFSDLESSTIGNTYNNVQSSGNAYGITNEDNTITHLQIWDRAIILISFATLDGRIDISATCTIYVNFELEYDGHDFGSGDTITLVTYGAMTWDAGDSRFEYSRSESSAIAISFDITSLSEATYGITSFADPSNVQVIWDRIRVVSYTVVTPAGDARVNIGTTVYIDVELHFDYDETDVDSGTITVNGISATYQSLGKWRFSDLEASTTGNTYNDVQSSGNTYGLTVEDNTVTHLEVWDRAIILIAFVASDGRINVGTTCLIYVNFELEYDGHDLGTGDTITLTTYGVMTWDSGDSRFEYSRSESSVVLVTFDITSLSEATYGITSFADPSDVQIIWDRIIILTTTVDDSRDNVNDDVEIRVTAQLEYDSHALGSGDTLYCDDVTMTWDAGDARFELLRNKATVGSWTFYVNSTGANEATYGITLINLDSHSVAVIWDRIIVLTTTVDDSRDNIGENVEIRVTLQLEYDGHTLGSGDSVTLDDVAMSWDVGDLRFELLRTQASVIGLLYYVNSSSEVTYGITALNLDSHSVTVIWDRIILLTTIANDTRLGVDYYALVNVTAVLDYDDTPLGSGDSVYLNSTIMVWNAGLSCWELTVTESIVGNYTFLVSSSLESTYGISALELDGYSCWIIFDRVNITISASLEWTIVYYNITVNFSGEHEFDSTSFTGTISIAGGGRYPIYYTPANQTFSVESITEPQWQVLAFISNEDWCVWDNVEISSVAYYWVQYSVDLVWLIWNPTTFYWSFNSSPLANIPVAIIQSYMNSTADDWGVVYSSTFGELVVGAFNPEWYYVNLSIYCEITSNGVFYNWSIWNAVLEVDIMHTIHLYSSGMMPQDDYITLWIHTYWANASFTIWDNDTLVGHSGSEGWYQIPKSVVVGLHNLTVLVNGTHGTSSTSGQTKDFSTSDSWLWLNFKYTVNPVTLDLQDIIVLQNNETVVITGRIYTNAVTVNYEVFEDGVLRDAGSISVAANGIWICVWWAKSSVSTTANFSLILDDGSTTFTIPGVNIVVPTGNYVVTYQSNVRGGDTINNNTYQNPTGMYLSPDALLFLLVSIVLSYVFLVVLFKRYEVIERIRALRMTH